VIALDSHVSELQRVAHVLLPCRVAAEKWGTLTNCAGRVQRVRPAVEPTFEAAAEGEWLWRLGAALGLAGFGGRYDVREISRQLAAGVPAFAGIDLDSVGDAGRPLAAGA
jgi:NADH dehydrogenase/NADH:ubiquinone oxidoreductase subunit G